MIDIIVYSIAFLFWAGLGILFVIIDFSRDHDIKVRQSTKEFYRRV